MSSRRRLWSYAVAAVVVVGAGVAGFIHWNGRADASTSPAASAPVAQTTDVVRMDLSTSEPMAGTIGYGPARPLKATGTGVLTWLPPVGKTVSRGTPVYRVNDQPVPLFYGSVPLFRAIDRAGLVGRDVRVVADNLKALGFPIGHQPRPGAVVTQGSPKRATSTPTRIPDASTPTPATVRAGDAVVTAPLIRAIKSWQNHLHLPETGRIAPGDIVVQPGGFRVASLSAQPGDPPQGELMTVTGMSKVINVPVAASAAGSMKSGDAVTVTMPDGRAEPGKITAVGGSVQSDATTEPGEQPKLIVTVSLTGDIGRIDSADVQVAIVAETHKGILAVPVGALLALSEGGYAVQVAGGELIAVKTGIINHGMAEVSGPGLNQGLKVVTTS